MTPLDAIVVILLILLCGHVGLLIVVLARALLPQRRVPGRAAGLAAGVCALAGELLALRGLLGNPAPIAWVGGWLGLSLLLALYARPAWRAHSAGRVAYQALFAAPLVVLFVVALSLR